jgi:hypothetical protein
MYMVLGLVMLLRGFADAVLMRSQQAIADRHRQEGHHHDRLVERQGFEGEAAEQQPPPVRVVAVGGLAVVGLLTRYRLWGPLWRDWLTSVDHKKSPPRSARGAAGIRG